MDEEVNNILLVATELKSPLATLRQMALSLGGLDVNNKIVRDDMVAVSDRAIRQVNDLMRIGKLGDRLFEMEPVAVRGVCDEVTRELQYLFHFNKRDLFIRYSNRARLVTANYELLKSIIYNYLLNAVYYTGDGVKSELVVKDIHDKVRVIVRDYGPSLPVDVWREMKRGFIEKPTSIAMRPGTGGLGLYIASRFSRYMGAGIGAVRHRDGTSFYVDLTVSKQARLF